MTGASPAAWDAVYGAFDGPRFSIWKEEPTAFFVEKIEFLRNAGVQTVLDAGCGDGRNLLALARAGFEVVGMDSSETAIALAQRVARLHRNVKVVTTDLRSLSLIEEFDAIVCDYVMVHLEEPDLVIANFARALRDGGILLVEFLSTDDPSCGRGERVGDSAFVDRGIFHRFYSEADVRNLLGQFDVLDVESLVHSDPPHVADYPRPTRHEHHSIHAYPVAP